MRKETRPTGNRFIFSELWRLLEEVFTNEYYDNQSKTYKRALAPKLGENRISLLRLIRNEDYVIAGNKKYLYTDHSVDGETVDLVYLTNVQSIDKKNKLTISFNVELYESENTSCSKLTYPFGRSAKHDLPYGFLFKRLLGLSNANNAKKIKAGQPLPKSVRYNPNMAVILFHALFSSPFEVLREKSFQTNDLEDIEKIMLDDLNFQRNFCESLRKDAEFRKELQLENSTFTKRFIAFIECNRKLYEALDSIETMHDHLENHGVDAYYNFETLELTEEYLSCREQYLCFLDQMMKAVLMSENNMITESFLDQLCLLNKNMSQYRAIYSMVPILFIFKEMASSCDLNTFINLYERYNPSSVISNNELEQLILESNSSFFANMNTMNLIIAGLFHYDQANDHISLKNKCDDFTRIFDSNSRYIRGLIFDRRMYSPEKWLYLVNEWNEIKKTKNIPLTPNYLNKFDLFSENGDNSVFQIEHSDTYNKINVNFRNIDPKIDYGCRITQYAGLYLKFIPTIDLNNFHSICFHARSQDRSIKTIIVEVKSKNRELEDKFAFEIQKEWKPYQIFVEEHLQLTQDAVEEIVLLIRRESFENSMGLCGEYELKDVSID